jgi:hypothetical protein
VGLTPCVAATNARISIGPGIECVRIAANVPSLNAAALLEFHRDNNRKSAARWSDFSPHRARMSALALERGGGQSVALLGAG